MPAPKTNLHAFLRQGFVDDQIQISYKAAMEYYLAS